MSEFRSILKSYPQATFDKEIAFKNPDVEFISFGHPLFEAVLEWVKREFFTNLQRGALFDDPSQNYDGIFWFFEGEVKDGKGDVAGKRLIAIYDGEEIREVNPSVLWDFAPSPNRDPIKVEMDRKKAQEYAMEVVEKYKQEIFEERERQAQIKKKYGIKSLEYLIGELDADLAELYERKKGGEKVNIVVITKKEKKKQYEEALKILEGEIEREMSLTISMPKFLGAILVKPLSSCMVSSKEIERIGMDVAMEYERSQQRRPEDVSKENLGFDIRSKKQEEIRYIEVKARKDMGEVALTLNEWFKAKRFREQYWLYVVANAATDPVLFIVGNPAENLTVEERVEVVRFLVSADEWKTKGVRVCSGGA